MPKLGNKHFSYTPEGQAAYKEAKAAKTAKPKKAGPISEDEKERAMGAYDLVKKKSEGFTVKGYTTLKEAQTALSDNISESDIADYYPTPTWEKASNKLVAQMWAMYKKSLMSKGPQKKR